MIGRRVGSIAEIEQPGDYFGPTTGYTGDLPAVFFLKPNARDDGAPPHARSIQHVCSPPHIAALRRHADELEADAKVFRTDREVAFKYAPTIGDAAVVNPALLRFMGAQFRAVADQAERQDRQ